MSYDRGLLVYDIAMSEYRPLSGLRRRTLRRDRPLSDGALWTPPLPLATSSPYRNITDHSCLKVYHKDPAQAFSHGPRPTNGDARVSSTDSTFVHLCHPKPDMGHLAKLQCICLWEEKKEHLAYY